MMSLATKSPSNDTSTKSAGVTHSQNPGPKSAPFFTGINTFIQTKSFCACDGGCPTCRGIQPKLTIGQPNDKYEQEADSIADRVMRMPEPEGSLVNGQPSFNRGGAAIVQNKPIAEQISPLVQRKCSSCGNLDEEEPIQLKPSTGNLPPLTDGLQSQIQSLRGGGQPLPQSTRAFFEPRFGHDFSHVRVHTNAIAADTAKSLYSKAFTTGKDVFFNAGQYSPGTAAGKRLLGHELTHVVQQGKNSISPHLQALTEEEKRDDLESEKYSGNNRLQKAFDNNPPLGFGESGDAVRLVQEGLVADGFAMPNSTKPTGEMDGGFGAETFAVVKKFQAKHFLYIANKDGIVGRETMGKLDELAEKNIPPPPTPTTPQTPHCGNSTTCNFSGPNAADYGRTWAKSTNPIWGQRFTLDCTNFVSQAMCAGGWAMVGGSFWDRADDDVWWYGRSAFTRASYTWGGAQNFYNFVNTSSRGTPIQYFSELQLGDVLQHDDAGNSIMRHSMIVTKKTNNNIYLSYHQPDKLDEPLYDENGKVGIYNRLSPSGYSFYGWHMKSSC